MTIASTTNKIIYTGDDSTTVFPYTFKIFASSDLIVELYVIATETVSALVETTDYTVTGVGNSSGGNVVLNSSKYPSGLLDEYKLIIRRVLPLTQSTDYVENDPFPAETHEEALDKLTMITQQLQEQINRAYLSNVVNTTSPTGDLQDTAGWVYDIRDFGSINEAITSIGSSVVTTLLVPNAQTLTANLTIPANITLLILSGGSIVKDSTYTLTINGPISAGIYQIFSGFSSGDVIFNGGTGIILAAWFGFSTSATAAVNKSAILAAINSCSKTFTASALSAEVLLHRGVFNVAADISILTNNITLSGASPFFSYTGDENPGTTLVFESGTSGIILGSVAAASKYITLKNMKIKGANLITNGVWISGQCRVEGVCVVDCVNGFNFASFCNQSNLSYVSALYNTGYGVLIDAPSNTVMNISHSNIRENLGHGIGILDGVGLHVENSVIEANYGKGLYIYRDDLASNIELISFIKCWFEANDRTVTGGGGHGYSVLISAYSLYVSNPYGIHFFECKFDQDLNINVVNTCRFDGCYGGDILVGATSTNVTTSLDTYGMSMTNNGNESNWAGSSSIVDYSATSTIVGFSSYTIKKIYAKKTGKTVICYYDIQGSGTGSVVSFTVPFAASSSILWNGITTVAEDDGTYKTSPGRTSLNQATSVLTIYSDLYTGTWTGTGERRVGGILMYEVA